MAYKLKEHATKESWREAIEFEAQKLRVKAKLLEQEATTMENMARAIHYNLEEILDTPEVKEREQ